MITNNFEILNNINPSSFNFNQNRQNQNPLSSSASILNPQQQLPSNSDLNNNTNNETCNATASTSTTTANYSQKSFHYYIKPSIEGGEGDKPSDFNNKKENNDIGYSLMVSKIFSKIINVYLD